MRSEGKETLLEAKDYLTQPFHSCTMDYLAYAITTDVSAFHLNLHYVCSNILYFTEEYKKEKNFCGEKM